MKKLIILSSTVLVFACSKKDIHTTASYSETDEEKFTYLTAKQKDGEPDPRNKRANIEDPSPSAPGCVDGNAYCLEVIVTPKSFVASLKQAVDNGTVKEFISYNINEFVSLIKNGKIIGDIMMVKQENKKMIYKKMANGKWAFLIGDKNTVSEQNYETAIVFND